jgi:hypothetical protein
MACWNILEDIKLLSIGVLEGRPDGEELTTDEVSNYLMGLEAIYGLKFEQMFNTFSALISERKI